MKLVFRRSFLLLICTKNLAASISAPLEFIQKSTFTSLGGLEEEHIEVIDFQNHTDLSHRTALSFTTGLSNSDEERRDISAEGVKGSKEMIGLLLFDRAVAAVSDSVGGAGLAFVVIGLALLVAFGMTAFYAAHHYHEDQIRREEADPNRYFRQQRSFDPLMSKNSTQGSQGMSFMGSEGRARRASPYSSPGIPRTEVSYTPTVSSAVHDRKSKAARTPTRSPYLEDLQATGKPSSQMNPRMSSSVSAVDLPLLCPALVLPHSEAWFAVSFERLHQALSGSFELFGLSGKPLLKVTPDLSSDEQQSFSIATTPLRSPILATVMAGSVGTSTCMQIKDGQGMHFGDLFQSSKPGRYSLLCGGRESLLLDFDTSTCSLCVITVKTALTVALACRSTDGPFFKGMDHLEIRVNPGVDPVLVLSCVLGVVLFGSAPPH
eukprot:CAMPEP_0170589126 /NCGR_PEP_ID=MMETSP0224-20130122/11190_1 /TAXON_ID=285029 /ORGANISM="Togula jolla, Strain CCCM 725" /LENGTH=433 /DNA_ID=CAMNT_0010912875 /DNA_START=75 /DNA_END=1376 /DNA_ORIENTATION=+